LHPLQILPRPRGASENNEFVQGGDLNDSAGVECGPVGGVVVAEEAYVSRHAETLTRRYYLASGTTLRLLTRRTEHVRGTPRDLRNEFPELFAGSELLRSCPLVSPAG
jgi:hypothetical protein